MIDELVAAMRARHAWEFLDKPAAELPAGLPDDLRRFIALTGGIRTSAGLEVAARVIPAQQALLGEPYDDDRSAAWVIVAEDGQAGTAARGVIDLAPGRRGRIYDAFWDRFGVAGSMPVISASFSDFLARLIDREGTAFWVDAEPKLGDAYD